MFTFTKNVAHMDWLQYLFKVNLCWIIFYVVYWVLFRKHTFFAVNRFYLLGALLAGICIPALELREQIAPLMSGSAVTATAGLSGTSNMLKPTEADWQLVIPCIYVVGVLLMVFLLLRALIGIYLVIRSGVSVPMEECSLVLSHDRNAGSFSFLRWMVVSREDYEDHFESIYAHELVHIRQWHSLDLLLTEVLKVFFWFNPVLWLYKSSLQQVHEYLADDAAPDKDRYATFMISYARQTMASSVVISKFFNKSLLMKRIHMIYKQRTPKWMGWKYVSILPLLAVTVMPMATRKYEYAKPKVERQATGQQTAWPDAVVAVSLPKYDEMPALSKRKLLDKKTMGTTESSQKITATNNGSESRAIDSLPELRALISQLNAAVASNDLKNADSLRKKINPVIWAESARLRKEQTETKLRSEEFAAANYSPNSSNVIARLQSEVIEVSRQRLQARWDDFDKIRMQFENAVSDLRHRVRDVSAQAERSTQDQIIDDLVAAGAAANKENLSYRLHNMFLIVNGVEQPEALHQKLKSKYLKYGWMEWVYNWDGATGHRFTGVRFNG